MLSEAINSHRYVTYSDAVFFEHLSDYERKYAAFFFKENIQQCTPQKISSTLNVVNESRPAYLLS
jgi:hypothetical protein